MDSKTIMIGVVTLAVAVILTMGVLTPVIAESTTGERTVQEGCGTMRFAYSTENTGYTITIEGDDSVITVTNGTDVQTLPGSESSIIYADSVMCVWWDNGYVRILLRANGSPIYLEPVGSPVTITRTSSGVTLSCDGEDYQYASPSYAFVPLSTGNYGFFENGTPVKVADDMPIPAVGGGFAGVYAYNDLIRYDGLGLTMQTTVDEEGNLTGASWVRASETEEEEPGSLGNLLPTKWTNEKEPTVKEQGTEGSGGLKSSPTPTYTDGDWGYNLSGDDAIIVSYSGAGGNIIIPSTVGGHTVTKLGTGNQWEYIFDPSLTGTLEIPSTVTHINAEAFRTCHLSGPLVLPEGLREIGNSAFKDASFTGELLIPSSVTNLGSSAFSGSGFTSAYLPSGIGSNVFGSNLFIGSTALKKITFENGLTKIPLQICANATGLDTPIIIPESITIIENSAFKGASNVPSLVIVSDATPSNATTFEMSGLTEVLDLSDAIDYNTDRYGIPATATVQDNIGDALGYISFVSIGSDAKITGPLAVMLAVIPIVVLAGIAVGVVGWYGRNRM